MSKPFNGHKNWNHWNVSLWIGNDEGLYNMARECIRQEKTRHDAACAFLELMQGSGDCGCAKTPDGAPYSVTTIRHAMRDM